MCRDCERSFSRRQQILAMLATGVVTAEACATKAKVSTRTVYRDIERLRGEGHRILGEAGAGYLLREPRNG